MTEYKQAKLEDSNVANIGSAEDKALRMQAAQTEEAFKGAGQTPGIEIWRIEKFQVKKWPKSQYGTFYDGDSFIVLNTTKTSSGNLRWDVHFWLGLQSSQDEMGVAAYKTVELDDLLQTLPVQHREVQGHESELFKSYFNPLVVLHGGIESGFNHVKPEEFVPVLLQVKGKSKLIVTQVEKSYKSLNKGDSFVLDAGLKIFIWNGSKSGKTEQFRAAQISSHLRSLRSSKPEEIRLGEEGNDEFWKLLGGKGPIKSAEEGGCDIEAQKQDFKKIFRLSDAKGALTFTLVADGNISSKYLDEKDAFIIDVGTEIFVWVGKKASKDERSFAMRYAMKYLKQSKRPLYTPITRIVQGAEPDYFKAAVPDRPITGIQKQIGSNIVGGKELSIKVVQARNLAAKDLNGKSDPFVKMYFDPPTKVLKTKTYFKTLNPVFNETFMEVVPNSNWKLIVEVWDYDVLTRNDFIGKVELTPSNVGRQSWYTLNDKNNQPSKNKLGEIEIELKYIK